MLFSHHHAPVGKQHTHFPLTLIKTVHGFVVWKYFYIVRKFYPSYNYSWCVMRILAAVCVSLHFICTLSDVHKWPRGKLPVIAFSIIIIKSNESYYHKRNTLNEWVQPWIITDLKSLPNETEWRFVSWTCLGNSLSKFFFLMSFLAIERLCNLTLMKLSYFITGIYFCIF